MIGVRWRKVLRDLTHLRSRTMLVVASIAVGVVAVGTISGAQAALDRGLAESYALARSASFTVYTSEPFDRALVASVERIRGVDVAAGRRTVSVRIRTGDTWRDLQLSAIPDWRDQRVDVVLPAGGTWPPERGEILLERSAGTLAELPVGGVARIELPDGRERDLRIAGTVWEPGASPAYYFGRLSGFATFETLADLGFDDRFQEVRVRAADAAALGPSGVRALADAVRLRVERAGSSVTFVLLPPAGRHPAQELLDAVFVILTGFGLLSLVVSGFLVANTIGVVLTQQTRQIGVMKAIGADRLTVARLYLGLVGAYAAIALAIAVPCAVLLGYLLTGFVSGLVNLEPGPLAVEPGSIARMLAAGLIVPLVAALVPVIRGTRVTVHAALRYTGVAETYGHGALDRLVGALRGLPRPALLALRNTFRRKGRLVLTLAALACGSAVAMTLFSVRDGLRREMTETIAFYDLDARVDLARATRTEAVLDVALRTPGVIAADAWQYGTALRLRPDGTESSALTVFGLPPDARTVRPRVEAGRWLLPDEGRALVVTANLLRDESDLRIGDTVRLRIRGRTAAWTLVGTIRAPTMEPALYVSDRALGEIAGTEGRTGMVAVRMDRGSGMTEAELATSVRGALEEAGIGVTGTTTMGDLEETVGTLFDTLILIITAMAFLLGIVGALGLAGTMTMNVVERSREIGVLRAVGAGDRSVIVVVLAEGLTIGLLAWAVGALLAIPLAIGLSAAIGEALLQRPIPAAPSVPGFALWLGVVLALATLGSILPAWRAARMPVREVLAYE
ncbi:MAG: FtsX-like permease family protein [Chloroflexota bacterium]